MDINAVVYCCAAVFAALSVVGPWLVGALGSLVTTLARRPPNSWPAAASWTTPSRCGARCRA